MKNATFKALAQVIDWILRHRVPVLAAIVGFTAVMGYLAAQIEVKTVFGKHDKVTMHPRSRIRKEKAAKKAGASTHTIAIDARGVKDVYYHREGFGSYRFHSMTKATDVAPI